MRTVALVAGAVFRESVRDRVPYSIVIFAVLLMAASYLISQMTAGQDIKVIKDLGLATVSAFGLLIASGWFGGELSYRYRVGVADK